MNVFWGTSVIIDAGSSRCKNSACDVSSWLTTDRPLPHDVSADFEARLANSQSAVGDRAGENSKGQHLRALPPRLTKLA